MIVCFIKEVLVHLFCLSLMFRISFNHKRSRFLCTLYLPRPLNCLTTLTIRPIKLHTLPLPLWVLFDEFNVVRVYLNRADYLELTLLIYSCPFDPALVEIKVLNYHFLDIFTSTRWLKLPFPRLLL